MPPGAASPPRDTAPPPGQAGPPRKAASALLQTALACGSVPAVWKVPMAETETRAIFDLPPDAALEARLDAEAEAAYQAGRVVAHARVREWLAKLAKGERVPPPRA